MRVREVQSWPRHRRRWPRWAFVVTVLLLVAWWSNPAKVQHECQLNLWLGFDRHQWTREFPCTRQEWLNAREALRREYPLEPEDGFVIRCGPPRAKIERWDLGIASIGRVEPTGAVGWTLGLCGVVWVVPRA